MTDLTEARPAAANDVSPPPPAGEGSAPAPRLRRRFTLARFLLALWAAALLAVVVAWVRSYAAEDALLVGRETIGGTRWTRQTYGLFVSRGLVGLQVSTISNSTSRRFSATGLPSRKLSYDWRSRSKSPPPQWEHESAPRDGWEELGFSHRRSYVLAGLSSWRVTAPLWSVLAAAVAIPAMLWAAAHRLRCGRRRGRNGGYCPACGYDLRATPDRCPECGANGAYAAAPDRAAHRTGDGEGAGRAEAKGAAGRDAAAMGASPGGSATPAAAAAGLPGEVTT